MKLSREDKNHTMMGKKNKSNGKKKTNQMGKKKQIEWEKKNKSSKSLVYFFFSCQGFDNTHYKKERTFLKVKHIINNKYMIPFLS